MDLYMRETLNRIKLFWVCSFLAISCGSVFAQQSLLAGFKCPPKSAKARTFWHWIDGNVTKEGITADLEAIKEIGIQEVELFNVDQGYPKGEAAYMSNLWLEYVYYAASEAERLGLDFCIHNCSGWSSSGSPCVSPEYSMQTVVYSEVTVEGGEKNKILLPHPEAKLNYYRDIVILAFPTPQNSLRINQIGLKSLSEYNFRNGMLPDVQSVPSSAIVPLSQVLNITSMMQNDGTLEWNIPEGKWTILRIGHTSTGTMNRPANKEGMGLEVDKMSRKAVDCFWNGNIEPVLKKLAPMVGKTFNNILIDSYEVGCGNWTDGFDELFMNLRKYDCIPYLPILAGYYIDSSEITERFLWDYRKTISDLMQTNYYGYFAELCHRHGLQFSTEPYGGPYDVLGVGATCDVPIGEFWVGGKVLAETAKMAASVAHLKGTPYVGAEAFTADGQHSRWLNQPSSLKAQGDWAWSEGINRFIYHSYTHQPWNIGPGMTFHMYGTEMSRLNTWWKPGKAYMEYVNRSQFLLQQGRFVADVLLFTGEGTPNNGSYCSELKKNGYDYDQISTDQIYSLFVSDGLIKTPAGGEYKLLMLPESEWMTPELLEKLKELVEAGAVIVGEKPHCSPSLSGYPKCDDQVEELTELLWGSGKIKDISVGEALEKLRIIPDFRGGENMVYIHRTTGEEEIYFVSNQQRNYRTESCMFRIAGKQPYCWNAETGEVAPIVEWSTDGETTVIPLKFEPEQSFFIVFEGSPQKQVVESQVHIDSLPVLPIDGLEIQKAEYGYFLPDGIRDVTSFVRTQLENNNLMVSVNNESYGGDPAPGVVKELRIKYRSGGKVRRMVIAENASATLSDSLEKEGFKLIQALYGHFPEDFDDNLPSSPVDVTSQVLSLVKENRLVIAPEEFANLPGMDKNADRNRLHLVYSICGEKQDVKLALGSVADFRQPVPSDRLVADGERLMWLTPARGEAVATCADGKLLQAKLKELPEPLSLEGSWQVEFPIRKDFVQRVTFDSLCSWTTSGVDDIKYFSGTAIYRKTIQIPKAYMSKDIRLELELGRVRNLAEVYVNGTKVKTCWKEPYVVVLPQNLLHAGENKLEIHVTNLWPNRLIGDARSYPEDCDWGEWTLNSFPDWVTDVSKRLSKRSTFTTWKHWKATDDLLPSGLMGPVILRPYGFIPFN